MINAYMGRILWVNLSTGEIKEEKPDEKTYRDFLGGYGLGAKIIYDNQQGGADPLGPKWCIPLIMLLKGSAKR